jgi:hypothetical protein
VGLLHSENCFLSQNGGVLLMRCAMYIDNGQVLNLERLRTNNERLPQFSELCFYPLQPQGRAE